MDGISCDDAKAVRGLEMLEGRSKDTKKSTSGSLKKSATQDSLANRKTAAGLDLGRRLLVVLKTSGTVPREGSSTSSSSTQAFRVVDHGEHQKEAIRRLFDAQVLLQSYEEQLQSRESQLETIQCSLKKVLRENRAALKYWEPSLLQAIGLTKEMLQEEDGIDINTKKDRRFEDLTPDEIKAEIQWQEKEEQKRKDPTVDMTSDSDITWMKIPYWLRNDENSRNLVNKFRLSLQDDFNTKGRLDNQVLLDHLWQLGLVFAQRWAGDPSDEVTKLAEELDKKHRNLQRESLMEISMLRQHIKRCEKKARDAMGASASLQSQLASLSSELHQARQEALLVAHHSAASPTAPAHRSSVARVVNVPLAGTGWESPEVKAKPSLQQRTSVMPTTAPVEARRSTSPSRPSVAPQAPLHRPSVTSGVDASEAEISPLDRAEAATRRALAALGRHEEANSKVHSLADGMGSRMRAYSESDTASEYGRDTPKGSRRRAVSPLFGDDTLEIVAEESELEQMDHELFEPLNQFDPDMRELMIDVINEKVRRILSLDPSKYTNGRLPFGLKPFKEKSGNSEGVNFEELYQEMKTLVERLKEENQRLESQLEAARNSANSWRQKFQQLQAQQSGIVVQETVEVDSRPTSRGRGMLTPKDDPLPSMSNGFDEENRELRQAQKASKEKIAELEKKIALLEKEIARLKEKAIADANAAKEIAAALSKAKAEAALAQKKLAAGRKEEVPSSPTAPEVDTEALEAAEKWKEAARLSIASLLKAVTKVASLSGCKAPTSEVKAMEAYIGDENPDTVIGGMRDVNPALQLWLGKAFEKYKQTVSDEVTDANMVKAPKTPPPPKEVVVERGADPKEVNALKKQIRMQQEELSRLLLTIDELRKRVEGIKAASNEAGIAGAVDGIMDRVGLKDIMDAGHSGPQLKGVFERLYQDAVQRIQRYGLIREQMMMANKAYTAVVSAITHAEGAEEEEIPDLDRLQTTTNATVRGMWYHTETLFRRACEYAMAQGVEATLMKAQKNSVADIMESMGTFDADFFLGNEDDGKVLKQRDRLPGRRGERPLQRTGGSPDILRQAHGGATMSPARLRKVPTPEVEPTTFTSYVAALKEARGDRVLDDPWARMDRKFPKPEGLLETNPKTLKAACAVLDKGTAGIPMATSPSLPALPKGRTMILAGQEIASPKANDAND